MKDLLLYMAKSLVDNPDSVTVTEVEGETTVLELRVAPEDMGKLIGRQGRIAKEIRTIIKSVAQRTGQKVSVEIVDCTNAIRTGPSLCGRPGFCACPGAGCACFMQRTKETRLQSAGFLFRPAKAELFVKSRSRSVSACSFGCRVDALPIQLPHIEGQRIASGRISRKLQ